MPFLLLALLIPVFLWYRRATTTLTRNCRWRQARARGVWRCAFCRAETTDKDQPGDCLRG